MKRRLAVILLAALAAAGVIHEVWWSRRFDEQDWPQ